MCSRALVLDMRCGICKTRISQSQISASGNQRLAWNRCLNQREIDPDPNYAADIYAIQCQPNQFSIRVSEPSTIS